MPPPSNPHLLLLPLLLILLSPTLTTASPPPSVTILNGTLSGLYNPTYNQDFFLGIPYAQPPTGPLRLDFPQSLNASWDGAREATSYSPECVGYGGDDVGYNVSEDCLTLNVIRPAGVDENAKLPVAVWIHGGGFVMGGSADKRYNLSFPVAASTAISQPILAVSLNYRLSGWGFLYSSTLAAQNLTNLGLRDQRLALHWIQENIAAFGGDPARVTIWGESAGAMSVGAHMIAYGGRDDGLFRAGIAESGGPNLFTLSNAALGQQNYDNITAAVGCTSNDSSAALACLRALPFDTLNDAMNTTVAYTFMPVIDGDFLPTLASTQLADGAFVRVPLLIGANSDEGTAFGELGVNTDADFLALVQSKGADNTTAQTLAALYPDIPPIGIPATYVVANETNTTLGTQYKRQAAFAGDYLMIGTRRATCEAWAQHGVPAYAYRFDVVPAGIPPTTGATHFQEVAFVFDNVEGLGYVLDAIDPFLDEPPTYAQLATLMSRMWVSFVVNGQPNAHGVAGVPEWPVYDLQDGRGAQDIVFDANVTGLAYVERDLFRAEGIAFINAVAASQFGR